MALLLEMLRQVAICSGSSWLAYVTQGRLIALSGVYRVKAWLTLERPVRCLPPTSASHVKPQRVLSHMFKNLIRGQATPTKHSP